MKGEEEECDFLRELESSNILGLNSDNDALIKQEVKSYTAEIKISKEGDPSNSK